MSRVFTKERLPLPNSAYVKYLIAKICFISWRVIRLVVVIWASGDSEPKTQNGKTKIS